MILNHTAATQVRHDSPTQWTTQSPSRGSITGSGNSLILLFRTFKYLSNVHSANRAGKDEILLWERASLAKVSLVVSRSP